MGPGGRRFKSYRPDHLHNFEDFGAFIPPNRLHLKGGDTEENWGDFTLATLEHTWVNLRPMDSISTQTLTEALHWRYATKKFDATRKIPTDHWNALEEAMLLAPSSFGLQPWRFIVVENKELLAKFPAVSWGQTQPVECSHYVVFAYRKDLSVADVDHFINRIAAVRDVSLESLAGYRGFIMGSHKAASENGTLNEWCARQVYLAIGQAMTAAAVLGIDTCPMEGIDAAQYDALLGLEAEGYASVCTVAFGYRASDDKHAQHAKVRFPHDEVIKHV